MDSESTKARRKYRKLYLDHRKSKSQVSKSLPQSSSINHVCHNSRQTTTGYNSPANQRFNSSTTSNYVRYENDNQNTYNPRRHQYATLQSPTANTMIRCPLSDISNVMQNDNANIQASSSNKNSHNNRIHQYSSFQSPSPHIFSRSPLSGICTGNYNDNDNNHASSSNNNHQSLYSNQIILSNISTVTQAYSSTRLSSGKHKLKRKTSNISPIPIIDLTTDEDIQNDQLPTGISKDYVDHGDQNVICQICNAKLWKDEAIRGGNRRKTSYSLCCANGKVELPNLKDSPTSYSNLFRHQDSKSKHFMKNIRRYNSMFSFTSMGGKVDSSINRGNGPYTFRLSGQNYHSIGSLLPSNGEKPKFSQLYIYDTQNEISNRQNSFGATKDKSTSTSDIIDRNIIQDLKIMLDEHNVLVKSYRMVRDSFHSNPNMEVKLRLIGNRIQDGRTYNLPTASEVAAIIVGDVADSIHNRDIMVETSSGTLKRINELHPCYIPLQYPLLFPYGDDGYRVDILHRGLTNSNENKRPHCTMREFFAYRIQDRFEIFSLILNSRRLLQQFLVDGYTMIESERLYYIRKQQKVLRCESFENLQHERDIGNTNVFDIGQRVILPSSFTGGSRYMMQNYLDAMSLCKWFGYPDLFITVTCNPKWPEIRRFLKDTTLHPEDRPDILSRLFKIKLDALIKDLKDKALFGKVQAVVYTIEFQKRGLPHSHICLFMHPDHKFYTIDHIDQHISAELPNINEDPDLHSLVTEFMIHGPCGAEKPDCPCMVDNRCSKNFPKKFSNQHSVDSDGFPQYRRRNDGSYVEKSGVKLDNRSVVSYNKHLLRKYEAHINVEWCNQAGSIKYLFKYINKGPDKTTIAVVRDNDEHVHEEVVDEINEYYDCRYLSACEATWRIFGYDVHYRTPSVVRLPFHLPGQQHIVYGADEDIEDVLNKPSVASSMFLSWMECNQKYEQAQNLTYVEFPTKFVWKVSNRSWHLRKRGFSIGRIHSVSPNLGEAYFLRILLNKVRCPTSFEDLRTVNGEICTSFRDACYAMGLLDDDSEYIEAIKEAHISAPGPYLRALFSTMLLSNTLSRPEFVWTNTWLYLSDGILQKQRRILKSPGLSLTENQIQNLTLYEIEMFLNRNNSTLLNFTPMPYPDDDSLGDSNNRLISEELAYDISDLQKDFQKLCSTLTDEQRVVFDNIITAVQQNKGGVFFIYGYGGTGKTFLWNTLSAAIRSKGEIVLNVASSGIASLLLPGGRTAHSRFSIPLNLNEDSICYIKPYSDIANLLKKTSLIIWDEAPMIHKHAFEALDRSLKDIFKSDGYGTSELPFGGKVIVFGGDFRQILPVITNGSRQDIVSASLCSSYIWEKCTVLKLTKNLRLSVGNELSDMRDTMCFANWLLDVGEGKVGGLNDGEAIIDIPEDLLIRDSFDPIGCLIDFVYPSILQNFNLPNYFQERAILAPKHDVVQEINDRLLLLFPGDEKEYLSADSLCQSDSVNEQFDERLYSPDVLNGLKVSGLPNHKLVLKVGVPIMLLRNIDQKSGLCNGTRLQVIALGKRVIEALIISGSNTGERTFIPRMSLVPSDKKIPFKFKRRQFPISVCFAMTINKSQGQSLSKVGLFLRQPVFTHGQLYVALSRVKSKAGLKILILDKDGSVTNTTTNVVYKEVFGKL